MLLEIRLPLRAAGLVDLVPEPRDLSEAELLVVVVHLRRPRLDLVVLEQRLEVSVEVRDGAEPELRRGQGVHLRDALLLEMRHRSQAVFLGFVEQRRHDVRRVCDELHAVHAVGRAPAHPLARFFGRVDRSLVPRQARPLIVEDARRDDLVRRAALFFRKRVRLRTQLDAPPRRNAVRHPQLEDVFGLGRLVRVADVLMQVDEAGQQEHARRVDFVVGLRRPIRPKRSPGCAGTDDPRDPVVLDDDVHRPDRRRAGAVDDHHAANRQRLERAEAFTGSPIRGGHDAARMRGARRLRLLSGEGNERDRDDCRCAEH